MSRENESEVVRIERINLLVESDFCTIRLNMLGDRTQSFLY